MVYKNVGVGGNRAGFAQENWLIIVASDHGGIGKGHGGPAAFSTDGESLVFSDEGVRPHGKLRQVPGKVGMALAFDPQGGAAAGRDR